MSDFPTICLGEEDLTVAAEEAARVILYEMGPRGKDELQEMARIIIREVKERATDIEWYVEGKGAPQIT